MCPREPQHAWSLFAMTADYSPGSFGTGSSPPSKLRRSLLAPNGHYGRLPTKG